MSKMHFDIIDGPFKDVTHKCAVIQKGLDEYNQSYLNNVLKDLSIFVDDGKNIIGGATLKYSSEALYLKLLWVDKTQRKSRIGSKLIALSEDFAHKKNLKRFFVDTYDFQAVDFYIKQGFSIIAEIPEYIYESSRVFFRKDLQNVQAK